MDFQQDQFQLEANKQFCNLYYYIEGQCEESELEKQSPSLKIPWP